MGGSKKFETSSPIFVTLGMLVGQILIIFMTAASSTE